MKILKVSFFLCCLLPAFSQAEIISATCSGLKGSRVEYLSSNRFKEKNHSFLESQDGTSSPAMLLWNTSKGVAYFSLDDTKGGEKHSALVALLYRSSDQFTFAGELAGAPILFTLYPNEEVGVYTMNTTWRNLARGAKSVMFHAKCKISISRDSGRPHADD